MFGKQIEYINYTVNKIGFGILNNGSNIGIDNIDTHRRWNYLCTKWSSIQFRILSTDITGIDIVTGKYHLHTRRDELSVWY